MGLLISPENPELLKLLRPLFYATPISSVSDLLMARVLQDRPFVERFLVDNRAALRDAYEFVAEWLMFHNLEYVLPFFHLLPAPYVSRCDDTNTLSTDSPAQTQAYMSWSTLRPGWHASLPPQHTQSRNSILASPPWCGRRCSWYAPTIDSGTLILNR